MVIAGAAVKRRCSRVRKTPGPQERGAKADLGDAEEVVQQAARREREHLGKEDDFPPFPSHSLIEGGPFSAAEEAVSRTTMSGQEAVRAAALYSSRLMN